MQLLTRTLAARASAIQLVGVAVVLAIGGNLVASYLWEKLGSDVALRAGIFAIVIVVVLVTASEIRKLAESVTVDGMLVMHHGEVLEVPEYLLSRDMAEAFRAILNENEAIRLQWGNGELPQFSDPKLLDDSRVKLLHEVMEFVLLNKLSSHLAETTLLRADQVRSYERDDLLPLLKKNRVLDQLSRPLEDRIELVKAKASDSNKAFFEIYQTVAGEDGPGILWSASDGTHMYSRLALELPKGSRAERNGDGMIRIESKFVRIELDVLFQGIATSLDASFIERYLGLPTKDFFGGRSNTGEEEEPGQLWKLCFGIHVKIKWLALVSPRAWKLYLWSESFVDACRKDFGQDEFLDAIHWAHMRTILITEDNKRLGRRGGRSIQNGELRTHSGI